MHKQKEAKLLLNEKGLRKTNQRIEMLEIFLSSRDSVSTSEIESKLDNPDRVTVYRTIKSFLESGLIHEINIGGRESRYALCEHECSNHEHSHDHIHLECAKCKTISCVDIPNYPQINIPGVKISELEISAKGICEKCMKAS